MGLDGGSHKVVGLPLTRRRMRCQPRARSAGARRCMSMPRQRFSVPGVTHGGFGLGREAHHVSTLDMRRAMLRRCRAVIGRGAFGCMFFTSHMQGVQDVQLCRHEVAPSLYLCLFTLSSLFLFSKKKGWGMPANLQTCTFWVVFPMRTGVQDDAPLPAHCLHKVQFSG